MSYDIREVQAVQLDLLKAFKAACEKLGLKYSLSSGTLLGAVRHGGFIPWDDDIDVMMLREDYDRFLKEGQAALSEIDGKYFLQHYTTEKKSPYTYAKIRNSNTCWLTKRTDKFDINKGIGMDIFPVDSYGNDKQCRKVAKRKVRLNRLNDCYDFGYATSFKSLIRRGGGIVYFIAARLTGMKRIHRRMDALLTKYPDGKWTAADFIDAKIMFPTELFYEYGEIKFEGETFSCIKRWDEYLKLAYGDYMQLPPESERVAHSVAVVDCRKSYKEYVGKK